jgi:hypothetical protein
MLLLRLQNCNHGRRKSDLLESLLLSYVDGLWYEYDFFYERALEFLVGCVKEYI